MILDTASTSTLHALAAARAAIAPETRDAGAPHDLIVYTSDQAHSSVEKGAMALGFGQRERTSYRYGRRVPHASPICSRPPSGRTAQRSVPCCIVATVGTTSTTSIDPVPAIAEIAEREKIWLHMDAAYAGSAAVVPEYRWMLDGCDRADSLVFNPHKWLMVPVDCSVSIAAARMSCGRHFRSSRKYCRTRTAAQHSWTTVSRSAAVSAP